MAWQLQTSITVTEVFQATPVNSVAVSPIYSLRFLGTFPTRHRLLLGYAKDATLTETLPLTLTYPSLHRVVLQPQIPVIWNSEFSFFVRSLPWGDSLPPLTVEFYWWLF